MHFASISTVLALKSYAKNWAAQFSRSSKQLFLVKIVSVFWSGEEFPVKMYFQATTRPHSQKIVLISIEMSPHKKRRFFSPTEWEFEWYSENQGHIFVSMRTHRLRRSARRVQLECALQSPTNHGYANMKIECYIYLVLSTLAWWVPNLGLRL